MFVASFDSREKVPWNSSVCVRYACFQKGNITTILPGDREPYDSELFRSLDVLRFFDAIFSRLGDIDLGKRAKEFRAEVEQLIEEHRDCRFENPRDDCYLRHVSHQIQDRASWLIDLLMTREEFWV